MTRVEIESNGFVLPVPANGGVLVLVSQRPRSVWETDQSPKTGYVVATGGGVRWLDLGMAVAFDTAGAVFYDSGVALVEQRAILGSDPFGGRLGTLCENGCYGPAACQKCPRDRWDRMLNHAARTESMVG